MYDVIYDDTDEIGSQDRSEKWLTKHGGFVTKFSPYSQIQITHLEGHFYLRVEKN